MTRLPLALLLAGALVLTGCGDDQPAMEVSPTPTEAPAAETPAETEEGPTERATPTPTAATSFELTLTGDAVPGGGDEDGTGQATLELDPEAGEVCFRVSVENVAPVNAMHIHEAPAGEAGGIVIGLAPLEEDGMVDDCVEADPMQIQAVLDNPAGFYLNLHNADFPAGVLRAQLA